MFLIPFSNPISKYNVVNIAGLTRKTSVFMHTRSRRPSRMEFKIDWIFPSLRNHSFFWGLASYITVAAVGIFSKLLAGKFNILI